MADTSGPMPAAGSKALAGWKPSAAARAFSSTSARRDRGTIIRVRAEQVWPEFIMQAKTPVGTAASKSASSRMMLGDLPPNSRATFLTPSAASAMTRLPAWLSR